MSDRPVSTWPPKPGDVVHLDTGWEPNSWTAHVMAVFDDYWVAIKEWVPGKGWRPRFETRHLWKHGEVRKGYRPRR